MVTVIGVRFRKAGKIYYFDPAGLELNIEDKVLVETARGIEFGECVIANREVSEDKIVAPLKSVIRKADKADIEKNIDNKRKEEEAFNICIEKIGKHNLDMKLIDVEYTFDNNKVIFYFTAEGRVDFRELVKDLASVFRTRIELRQIGVRDEAKMIGGLGPCGRPLCCSSFLGDFEPVSIRMAKEQNLSLNPSKISGICGRLMCCLNYEQENYEEIRKKLPKVGAIVDTPYGQGEVLANSAIKENVKIKTKIDGEETIREVSVNEIKLISGEYEDAVREEEINIEIQDEEDREIIKDLFKED
ncbi:PSP1 domain-containing protein [Haloimpatiens lingqiaonensis]|uniref:PSP1 domain-containing protein n=1 Tax=Haloimpatiens lingqiaonensis TaxID=1380675 RepID=UPI0010FDD8BD|nr:stage 0 sporulation family protein [Haloimpatiens lingqiaonensis]